MKRASSSFLHTYAAVIYSVLPLGDEVSERGIGTGCVLFESWLSSLISKSIRTKLQQ